MPDRLTSFLATIAMVQGLELEQVRALAAACSEQRVPAGARVLGQGMPNSTLFFLRSGVLAVRTRRGTERVTVAHLEPPAVIGEVSFVTGRTCSADIDVVVDATLVALPLAALNRLPEQRHHLFRGLMAVLAERLHATVTDGVGTRPRPVVMVRHEGGWPEPAPFIERLAASLAREVGQDVLIADLGSDAPPAGPARVRDGVWASGVTRQAGTPLRATLPGWLTAWAPRFGAVLMTADRALADEDTGILGTHQVWLLGPHAAPPAAATPDHFVVQDARGPGLPALSARWRLAATDAEGLARTCHAVARGIAGRQVGLALGGGGAWGWAHIGVLEVLDAAGVPVDAVAGCSMGSVIGGLYASGATLADLRGLVDYWRRHHRRWTEWRVWRLHVANERRLTRAFRHVFGDRRLEHLPTAFWANAIDIETGEEVILRDGLLVDAARASMAFPGWTPPVRRDRRLLVDAAFIDPVPSALVQQMGCDHVIAVNTLGPMPSRKLESRLPWQAYDVWDRYVRMAAHEIGRVHGEMGAESIISPAVGDATMLSFGRSDELIDAGRRAAEERLPQILDTLSRRAMPAGAGA